MHTSTPSLKRYSYMLARFFLGISIFLIEKITLNWKLKLVNDTGSGLHQYRRMNMMKSNKQPTLNNINTRKFGSSKDVHSEKICKIYTQSVMLKIFKDILWVNGVIPDSRFLARRAETQKGKNKWETKCAARKARTAYTTIQIYKID